MQMSTVRYRVIHIDTSFLSLSFPSCAALSFVLFCQTSFNSRSSTADQVVSFYSQCFIRVREGGFFLCFRSVRTFGPFAGRECCRVSSNEEETLPLWSVGCALPPAKGVSLTVF